MKKNLNTTRTAIKISLVAAISLLLLIPLTMVKGVIDDREDTKDAVTEEVANSYAKSQTISAPYLTSYVLEEITVDKKKQTYVEDYNTYCPQVDYAADVETDILHRSIYDVIVYNSKIQISGKFPVTEKSAIARNIEFRFQVTDIKGFNNPSQLTFGGKTFEICRKGGEFVAGVTLPKEVKVGDTVDYTISFGLKGTESLFFCPSPTGETSLAINSAYPHPSFHGSIVPNTREITDDGFNASWEVSSVNSSSHDNMGVKFVDPANPYQQSMRSAKYGILIIILVFVAGLFVEFLTKKEINPIQYAVIGLSLVLFYSLLLAFSEFMTFGVAYLIATAMTTIALTLYFKAILKSRSAYTLGGFVALVYALNHILLQLDTYALLAGSLVLFLLLCVVMYLTANTNTKTEQQ